MIEQYADRISRERIVYVVFADRRDLHIGDRLVRVDEVVHDAVDLLSDVDRAEIAVPVGAVVCDTPPGTKMAVGDKVILTVRVETVS